MSQARERGETASPSDSSRQSGTRRIAVDPDATVETVSMSDSGPTSDSAWPVDDDADAIPTQPHSQPPPERPTVIDTLADATDAPTVDLPPPSFKDERDTIPAPPPGTPEEET